MSWQLGIHVQLTQESSPVVVSAEQPDMKNRRRHTHRLTVLWLHHKNTMCIHSPKQQFSLSLSSQKPETSAPWNCKIKQARFSNNVIEEAPQVLLQIQLHFKSIKLYTQML